MLTAYVAERLPARVMLPASALIALAAGGFRPDSPWTFARDAAIALLLVAQFRVWDDIADRHHDAVAHPYRVLVTAPSVRSAVLLCVALGAANVAWIAARDGVGLSGATLVLLDATFAAWYASRGPRSTVGDHLLLAKYPAFVLITAGDRIAADPARVAMAAAAIYLGACVYEAWHDRTSPAARHRLLVTSEALLLVVMLAVLSIGGRS